MQYVIYVAVATPLLFGWLFWESAHTPPQPPLFASGLEAISNQPVRTAESKPAPGPAAQTPRRLARNEATATD